MALGYSQITFGNQILNIKSLNRKKVPATIKQRVGGKIVINAIPGRDATDWSLDCKGVMFDTSTTATASRTALEALDDQRKHHYSDGLITGSYIITDLSFSDNEDSPVHYNYSVSFIQYNQ